MTPTLQFLLVLGTSIAIANGASAQEPADPVAAEARALFDQGVAAFDDAQYADALALFERSYALRASPLVLYNIAVAQRRLGRPQEAVRRLREYLEMAEVDDARREVILAEIEELEADTPPAPVEIEAPPRLPRPVTAEEPRSPPRPAPLPAPRGPEPEDDTTTIWESPLTWVLSAVVLLGAGGAAWLVLRDRPETLEGNFDPPVVMALE